MKRLPTLSRLCLLSSQFCSPFSPYIHSIPPYTLFFSRYALPPIVSSPSLPVLLLYLSVPSFVYAFTSQNTTSLRPPSLSQIRLDSSHIPSFPLLLLPLQCLSSCHCDSIKVLVTSTSVLSPSTYISFPYSCSTIESSTNTSFSSSSGTSRSETYPSYTSTSGLSPSTYTS